MSKEQAYEKILASEHDALKSALREARPVVANAAADPTASPWLRETRAGILKRIDDVLARVCP